MHDPIDRRTLLAVFASALVAGCGGSDDDGPVAASSPPPPAPAPSPPPPPPPPAGTDPQVSSTVAIKWSRLAVDAMLADTAANPPGLSPMEQSRILAMVFIAGHDALNQISRKYRLYLPQQDTTYPFANPEATYEVAVSKTLQALLPAHAAEFAAILAERNVYPYGDEVDLGEFCATRILADRADDGAAQAQGPYAPSAEPGAYQPTPPVDVATFVNWGKVRPFVASSGSQFRAPPPYAVTDDAYTSDFDEVRRLGAATGSQRSAEQSELAKFWLESTPLSWQRIVTDAVAKIADDVSLWFTARLFARLQMAQADAYITSLETKYHYAFWRPVTAIRAADTDGNPATAADPEWMPFDPVTPPVPEYPSAHAAAGTAGAVIATDLDFQWPLEYRSSTGSGSRTYSTGGGADWASYIAREIGLSRIYVGYHFRRAVDAGWDQGRRVGEWVSTHALPPN